MLAQNGKLELDVLERVNVTKRLDWDKCWENFDRAENNLMPSMDNWLCCLVYEKSARAYWGIIDVGETPSPATTTNAIVDDNK